MIDWLKIKNEYVTGLDTCAGLERKYGMKKNTVQRRAYREDWRGLRNNFRRKTHEAAVADASVIETDRLRRLMDAAAGLTEIATRTLEDDKQFNRYIVSAGGDTQEKVFDKVDTRALRELTGVLKDLTGLMRDYYDIPTPSQKLLKKRLEAKLGGENDAVEVVLCGEVDKWAD